MDGAEAGCGCGLLVIVGIIWLIVVSIACFNGPADHGATKVLLDSGYGKVSLTGYRWFGCDDSDTWHDGFTAVGPTGRKVSGVVCSGIMKNSTVRLD